MEEEEEKRLKQMAEAFKELANVINSRNPNEKEAAIQLGQFSCACSFVSPLFRCLGMAFKFAELDYVAKVDALIEASKSIVMLPVMMDGDMEADCVCKGGSHTMNLLRVKRGIDMVKVLFEHMMDSNGETLEDFESTGLDLSRLEWKFSEGSSVKSLTQVFARYHGWAIRKAVNAGMYVLPTKAQLLKKLNEDENSARIHMQSFVASASPVVLYVDQLFMSRELGVDW